MYLLPNPMFNFQKTNNLKFITQLFITCWPWTLRLKVSTCFARVVSPQLLQRNSSVELLQVVTPLFQNNLSFRQVMAAASRLVCGYTEGAFSRVTSFNWYEDNNYKAFLGISSSRAQAHYTYDNSTSELNMWKCLKCISVPETLLFLCVDLF